MGKTVKKIVITCPSCNKEFHVNPSEDKKYIYCSVECRKNSNRINKTCCICGKKYFEYKTREKHTNTCGEECYKTFLETNNNDVRICAYCNKEFLVPKSSAHRYKYCSLECRSKDKRISYNCDYCGKKFSVLKNKVEHNKNGVYCSHKRSTDANISGSYINCLNCGKSVYRYKSKMYKNTFCSNKCHAEYDKNMVEKSCFFCGKKYETHKSTSEKSKFCSLVCKNKWQSEFCVGVNNPNFSRIKVNCLNCNKELMVQPYRLKTQTNFFCNTLCFSNYYSIQENRTEKQKERDKNIHLYMKPRYTKPHNKIIELLNKNKINYITEYNLTYQSLDIYLQDYNLGIEVHGDFWHCSPLFYSNIEYSKQYKSIVNDKSKHTYVLNHYGYEILYLWENDVNKNIELCLQLLMLYITSRGRLENYNSFNYQLINEKLYLASTIFIPFQEMTNKEIKNKLKIKK